MLLIHGVGLDHTMWDPLVTALSGSFRLIRYDIVGHGQTPVYRDPLTFADLTAQLKEVLDDRDIGSVSLVGFSLGALIAQAFTLAHPDYINKLVLLNSAHTRTPEQQAGILSRLNQVVDHGASSNVKASIERWFTPEFRHAFPEQIRKVESRLERNNVAGFVPAYRLFAESDSVFASQLGNIRIPTMVITGELDVGSTPDMSRTIAAGISDSVLKIYPGVKHMLPVENAEKLSEDLCRFLQED